MAFIDNRSSDIVADSWSISSNNTNTVIPSGVFTRINMGGSETATGSNPPTMSAGVITINSAGWYDISGGCEIFGITAPRVLICIFRNSTEQSRSGGAYVAAGIPDPYVSQVLYCAAGAVIGCRQCLRACGCSCCKDP